MPTKIPEVGRVGTMSVVGKTSLVGRTTSLGTPPEPVGSASDEGIMNGPRMVDPSVAFGSSVVVGVVEVGESTDSGTPPVDATLVDELGSTVLEGGWMITSGRPPVEPTAVVSDVLDSVVEDGGSVLSSGVDEGGIMTDGKPPVEATLELEEEGRGRRFSSGFDGVGIGMGGCGVYRDVDVDVDVVDGSDFKLPVPKFPVPINGLLSGTSVVVLLIVTVDEDEDEDEVDSNEDRCNEAMSDSQKEVVSPDDCRSSRFDELLEDEDEDDEDVEVAGAVVFVTICRLTCRGK
jgi:hypothetical protein